MANNQNPAQRLEAVAEQLRRQPVAPLFQARMEREAREANFPDWEPVGFAPQVQAPPPARVNNALARGPKAKNFVGGMGPQARARDRLRKEE